MNNYYTYVFYDENWNPYYVGKGCYYRKSDRRKREIPIADTQHTQLFEFIEEWEAFECERELINLWGRRMDGGLLMNISLGGPGTPGVPNAASALIASQAAIMVTRKPVSLKNIATNEVRSFSSIRDACRELGLSVGCVSKLSRCERKTHKGWKLNA